MTCEYCACLAEPGAETVVEIAEIHGNRMDSIRNRSKFRNHARINDHTDALKALLTEDAAKHTKKLAQLCPRHAIAALPEDAP